MTYQMVQKPLFSTKETRRGSNIYYDCIFDRHDKANFQVALVYIIIVLTYKHIARVYDMRT